MTTLYVAWQDRMSRRWFPVGRLVYRDSEPKQYEFAYIQGAKQANESAGFVEIPGFPTLDRRYLATELFPAFRIRTMNASRPDRGAYLWQFGLDEAHWDAVTELAVSGGLSHADNLELFPAVEPDQDGRFQTRFVVHGMRHLNQPAIDRCETLRVGESLRLAIEVNNPTTSHSVLVNSGDYCALGWLPRYLVDGLYKDDAWMVSEVSATVAKVNYTAPLSSRLLVDFRGRLPRGFNPMKDLDQFFLIAEATWS